MEQSQKVSTKRIFGNFNLLELPDLISRESVRLQTNTTKKAMNNQEYVMAIHIVQVNFLFFQ